MKIMLDAGHGPETPGKQTPDGLMKEYQFNRAVANHLAPILREYKSVELQTVHSDARDVPLRERTDQANRWGADLYVSIHANAAGGQWSDAQGIETFVYTTNPSGSRAIAEAVQAELVIATGRRNRGVKLGDLHVLRETNMDAILIECGFMTNRQEAELLKDDSYRRICAGAIANAIIKHYGLKPKKEAVKVDNWRIEMGNKAIDNLAAKGKLESPELWKMRLKNGEMERELPWLLFALIDRVTD
ncbi:N-acetylmuramoyl-L-alanine amidase [Paenibacillus lutrae]|uniref:N-acetylmuramoyl-L-alanine amidase n=1 Tax=Paenibacillus lutrae TaxID=2078573 RepID=A0A7X3JZQ5_9BACL|nr:N-acetylmuramoyl-L-alanine amidase [Paenibacillus lutrae]MVP00338.1 N-acetylmuramoyl-L-alanine amidase [Paenibacillus lutrae]